MSTDVHQCPQVQIQVFWFWTGSAWAAKAPRLPESGRMMPVRIQPFPPPARTSRCFSRGETFSRFRWTAADIGGHWWNLVDLGRASLNRRRTQRIPRAGIVGPAGIMGRDPIPSFPASGPPTLARGMFFWGLENRSAPVDIGGHWWTSVDIPPDSGKVGFRTS